MNTNPAGIFQPQKHHPLSSNLRGVLSADARVIRPVEGENLLVAAEENLIFDFGIGPLTIFNAAGPGIFAVAYLKGYDDRFYAFADSAQPVAPGQSLTLGGGIDSKILDSSTFRGLYLFVEDTDPTSDIRVFLSYYTCRDVNTTLTTEIPVFTGLGSPTAQISPEVSVGSAVLTAPLVTSPGVGLSIYNFGVDADLLLFMNNGEEDFLLSSNFVPGSGSPIFAEGLPTGTPGISNIVPPGWSLRAASADPDAVFATLLTTININQSPVRPDQGGAY